VQRFVEVRPCPPSGIHPTAVVGPDASLGKGVALGAHCYVGERARLGDRVTVYPGVFIGADCVVGDDTVIHANAVLREGTVLGARCLIHACAAIATDGFGFYAADGRQHKIPQMGTVELGDDVEVGSLTAIDRATFGKTRVGSGTKIDNLVQIGHNTQIGDHCVVCGASGISGSVSIGNHVTLAARASVAGHLEIGDHVTVAGMGGVTKSVQPGKVVSGFPAVDHTEEKRMKASLRRLPDALRAIRALEERVEQLETMLNAGKTENRSR
jgi:UDP-3-O-[3-hydroxymyristoyl] glucosamine N-acyltransferase